MTRRLVVAVLLVADNPDDNEDDDGFFIPHYIQAGLGFYVPPSGGAFG